MRQVSKPPETFTQSPEGEVYLPNTVLWGLYRKPETLLLSSPSLRMTRNSNQNPLLFFEHENRSGFQMLFLVILSLREPTQGLQDYYMGVAMETLLDTLFSMRLENSPTEKGEKEEAMLARRMMLRRTRAAPRD